MILIFNLKNMKVSFFWNTPVIWIDYSNNENCALVLDLEWEELENLTNWKDFNLIDWKIEFYEWKNWLKFIEQEKENKISEIKQKYQDLIFTKYSLTDQLNMSNEVSYITSMAVYEKRDFTELEAVRLNEIKQAKLWIDEQRKACSDEILLI